MTSSEWLPIAEIARPHGVRGELRLKLYNEESETLFAVKRVLLREKDGKERELRIEKARPADKTVLLKLATIDDRDVADLLRGAVISAHRSEIPPPDEGEFFASDLIGAEVVTVAGEKVGTVTAYQEYPTIDCYVVDALDGGRPYEIPLVDTVIAEVDVAGKRIVVHGLEDIVRA